LPEVIAMSTAQSELAAFHKFIGECLENGQSMLTPGEAVQAFQVYRGDLERLREELRPSLERAERGVGHEFDFEVLKRRCRESLHESLANE
jgi:hypothetical protein